MEVLLIFEVLDLGIKGVYVLFEFKGFCVDNKLFRTLSVILQQRF